MQQFVTREEFCQALRISRSTFHAWLKLGKVRTVRVGRRHLIPSEALRRLERAALDDHDGAAA